MSIKSMQIGTVLVIMMGLALPAFATSYSTDVSDCSLTNIGPNLWQAKFNITVIKCYGCVDTTANWVVAYVPKLNEKGKPAESATPDQAVSDAKWSNFSLTGTSVNGRVRSDSLFFNGNNENKVIYNGTSVSVNFSTEGNNAYPAIFLRNINLPGSLNGFLAWIFLDSKGCIGNSIPPSTLPPIEELVPVEPEFSLKSAVWNITTADVGDLPDVAAAGNGYTASIQNVANNNLCVSYVSAGVKNNAYALGVTNGYSMQGGRNLFMMKSGDSQLLYNLKLISNDGVTDNNFEFPDSSTKYITLSRAGSSIDKRSQMCWTPQINLFKNATTVAGMHSDILNFIITPKT